MMKINYAGTVNDETETAYLLDAVKDFRLAAGKYAARFERELGAFLGIQHVSLCNSGSSANLLAFMALTQPELGEGRIRPGDEVITVAAAFPTTVAPIVLAGAVPVFVDITIPEYNIDCSQLEAALSPRTKAVMLAHTAGNPFDVRKVVDFCEQHRLWLIEDNCDSLGSRYLYRGEWRYTGTIGHIGTSSFYPAHHMAMGEGGAVYTDDRFLHLLINSLRDWGRDCVCNPGQDDKCGRRFQGQRGGLPRGYDHKYVYSRFGYNLKATEMQAAVGCAQLEKLPGFIEARRRNWQALREKLSGVEWLQLPDAEENSDPSWFAFLLSVKDGAGRTRNDAIAYLEANGIQTRMLFAGNILKQPCSRGMRNYRAVGDLANTDYTMRNTFLVGIHPGLAGEQIEYIADHIMRFDRRCNAGTERIHSFV